MRSLEIEFLTELMLEQEKKKKKPFRSFARTVHSVSPAPH